MNFSFSGKAAYIALAVAGAIVVLILAKPEVLSWVLGALYTGPR